MMGAFARMLADGTAHHIHAAGVCGVGLSGVAKLLQAHGWVVTGCDAAPNGAIADHLHSLGINVEQGHSPSHISEAEALIYSPAIHDDNAELAAAHATGIPVLRRGEALAAIAGTSRSIAICGTHGKTTTSCFVVSLLSALGEDPSWCIGGHTRSMGATAGIGANNGPLVIEADESDGTLALYRPSSTIVTCIEPDHLENFSSFDALKETFTAAIRATSGAVVCCADDTVALEAARSAAHGAVFTYGFSPNADFAIEDLSLSTATSIFHIRVSGGASFRILLPLPGRHNVLNATGAFALCVSMGHSPDRVASAMDTLRELPLRRFERHASPSGAEIISDYSHHPTEIAALVSSAALDTSKRLVAVFQPHRFSRTRALAKSFPASFRGISELLLLPVYAASEQPLHGGGSEDLYREFRIQHEADATIPIPMLCPSISDAARYLEPRISNGDRLLVIGAGDVVGIVPILENAPATINKAWHVGTSLSIGGDADEVITPTDQAELRSAILSARSGSSALRVVGQGTNILIPDTGLGGVTIHLSQKGFASFERLGETDVRVGCALPGSRLLSLLRDAGLSGIEYMAGIPGCVGGWLAMNAGTRYGEFGDRVVSAEAIGPDGEVFVISDFGFGYRRCAALKNGAVCTSVTLRMAPDDPSSIAKRMQDFASKRFDFSGLRTAGSVFRNPPGASAGRLLEEAGCKGLRVGGAYVCERHANIIAVEDGATASDFLALAHLMRDKVDERFGIVLQMEIKTW